MTARPESSELSGNLLIVDDDPEVLLAAELVLKKRFPSVSTTTDPRATPELLGKRSFDVISST